MCGEHLWPSCRCTVLTGSSPHVRGARGNMCIILSVIGIIPACAGSTNSPITSHETHGDHPRMCGEHVLDWESQDNPQGSSPHVRGARSPSTRRRGRRGIIPACAGSTPTRRMTSCTARDHPRMCGEHASRPVLPRGARGSSPHVRGALGNATMLILAIGIIPACAGSTELTRCLRLWTRDHPRMCGEHAMRMIDQILTQGSSPHVRGALAVVL